MEVLLVVCPPGIRPGQSILVETPAGVEVEVVVPAGVQPYSQFQVEIETALDGTGGRDSQKGFEAAATADRLNQIEQQHGARRAYIEDDRTLTAERAAPQASRTDDEIVGELAEALAELQRTRSPDEPSSGNNANGLPEDPAPHHHAHMPAIPASATMGSHSDARHRLGPPAQPLRSSRNASPRRAVRSPEERPEGGRRTKRAPSPPALKPL